MTAPKKNNLPFTVIKADIGALAKSGRPWLAVVSSDDSYLSHGGGSSRAVWRAADLSEDLPQQFSLPIPLASVVTSTAGKLKVGSILHAITLDLDTRARLDINQLGELFVNLSREIARLARGTEPREILMPLVAAGAAGVPVGAIADQIAILAAHLQPIGVRCTIAVIDDAVAISRRLHAGYGLIYVPIKLEEWIKISPPRADARLAFYCRAVGVLLEKLAQTGEEGQADSATMMKAWGLVHTKLPRGARGEKAGVPWDALEFIPEVIGFRNLVAHGLPSLKPYVIAANMAESALKGLLWSVELGLFAGFDRAKVERQLAQGLGDESGVKRMRFHMLDSRWRLVHHELRESVLRIVETDRLRTREASLKAKTLRAMRAFDACEPLPEPLERPGPGDKRELPVPNMYMRLSAARNAPVGKRELPVPSIIPEHAPSAVPAPPSSNPARELAKVLAGLSAGDRNYLLSKMDEMEYRGDEDKRLVEYCMRTDPAVILDELGARTLREVLHARFGIEAKRTDSIQALRDQLLQQIGFKIPPEPTGPASTLAALKKHHAELSTADSDAIRGKVIKGSAQVERTTRDLLRFLCLYLFGKGPEKHFKGQLSGAAVDDFSKATLGTLLHCLEMLAKEIDKLGKSMDEDKVLKELGGPLSATRLAPEGLLGISKLRNSFAHFEKEQTEHHDKHQAQEFFRLAEVLLEHWLSAKPPIYPTMVVVEEIKLDRWNRRIVTARTDHSQAELIVSDELLKPGEAYFMYPLSNPMRVDPILIAFHPDA